MFSALSNCTFSLKSNPSWLKKSMWQLSVATSDGGNCKNCQSFTSLSGWGPRWPPEADG